MTGERQPTFLRSTRGAGGASDAEIGERGVAFEQENVLGLDVAVDDTEPVRVAQSIADFAHDRDCFRFGKGSFADESRAKRFARHVRHDVVEPARGLAGVVQGDDVRMVELGRDPDLVEKTLRAYVGGDFRSQDFESDSAPMLAVLRLIHDRHTAFTNRHFDDVSIAQRRFKGEIELGHVNRSAQR
jgi:hypothetical protein